MSESKVSKGSVQAPRYYWTCQVVCKGMVQEKWNFDKMMQDEKAESIYLAPHDGYNPNQAHKA